jgi:hypothetical protein
LWLIYHIILLYKEVLLIFIVPNSSVSLLEVLDMPNMLKLTVLSIGLLAGTALVAQAQSVSSLPPNGAAPPQNAVTQPYSPTQAISPNLGSNPGGNSAWKEEHYQPPAGYASNPAQHLYTAPGMGPRPN